MELQHSRITPRGKHFTQPNQTMSLKEMLTRALLGQRIPEYKSAFEYSPEDVEEEDIQNGFDVDSVNDSIFEPEIADVFLEKEYLQESAQARTIAQPKARKAKEPSETSEE